MVGGLVEGDGDVGPHFRWVSATEELAELINVPFTFSAHCRSGIVGDLCRCWRCRGEKEPTKDESAAARDAQLVDRGKTWRLHIGAALSRQIAALVLPTRGAQPEAAAMKAYRTARYMAARRCKAERGRACRACAAVIAAFMK